MTCLRRQDAPAGERGDQGLHPARPAQALSRQLHVAHDGLGRQGQHGQLQPDRVPAGAAGARRCAPPGGGGHFGGVVEPHARAHVVCRMRVRLRHPCKHMCALRHATPRPQRAPLPVTPHTTTTRSWRAVACPAQPAARRCRASGAAAVSRSAPFVTAAGHASCMPAAPGSGLQKPQGTCRQRSSPPHGRLPAFVHRRLRPCASPLQGVRWRRSRGRLCGGPLPDGPAPPGVLLPLHGGAVSVLRSYAAGCRDCGRGGGGSGGGCGAPARSGRGLWLLGVGRAVRASSPERTAAATHSPARSHRHHHTPTTLSSATTRHNTARHNTT
jgi:hypothetical protein